MRNRPSRRVAAHSMPVTMMRCAFSLLILLAISLSASGWVEKRYTQGQLVCIEERKRDRVLLYQVNTPIMTEEPYLFATVEVKDVRYDGEYFPWRRSESLPLPWSAGEPVWIQVEKHFFYVKTPHGEGIKFALVRKVTMKGSGESKGATDADEFRTGCPR